MAIVRPVVLWLNDYVEKSGFWRSEFGRDPSRREYFRSWVEARGKLDLDRTDAPGRKVRTKNVGDIKQVEVLP